MIQLHLAMTKLSHNHYCTIQVYKVRSTVILNGQSMQGIVSKLKQCTSNALYSHNLTYSRDKLFKGWLLTIIIIFHRYIPERNT